MPGRQARRAMLNERSLMYTTDLSAVRTLVREEARHAGLPGKRAIDLELAVSEAAANTVRHAAAQGHRHGTLRVWFTADEIVCEIRDGGVIADALAGRRQPGPGALTGHGLWLVRQVCDEVEIASGADGTTVRMRMALRRS
jgi:anti-sigma regulatory factor (Ser/Thr protein kinase)